MTGVTGTLRGRVGHALSHVWMVYRARLSHVWSSFSRAAVSALNDVLTLGQDQVYRPLEEEVIPALKKSTTFGNFVDDLSSLEVRMHCNLPLITLKMS